MVDPPRHPAYSDEHYEIRPSVDDAETMKFHYRSMLELGWDRGPADLATYMIHSHSRGMLQAFPSGSSNAVGEVSAIINDNSTGWVATFIVDKAYQGLKIGAALWDSMMSDFAAQKTEIIGLDAVPIQRETYERRGFVVSHPGKLMTRSLHFTASASSLPDNRLTVLDIRKIPAILLTQYDLKYSGFSRLKMWEQLLDRPDVLGSIEVRSDPPQTVDDINAMMVLRRCPGGVRLGPLYAIEAAAAGRMLDKLGELATPKYVQTHAIEQVEMSAWPEEKILESAHIIAEISTGNAAAVKLFEDRGFGHIGEYYRMWLNGKATPAQSQDGAAETGLFASFDAAVG